MAESKNKCENCIFYKLQSQPSYLLNGKSPVLCCEYKQGIKAKNNITSYYINYTINM